MITCTLTSGTFATGDSCRIAWRFDGPCDAPVLLLSNSLGTSMAMWDPQMAAFAARFRVLRYDGRGHGGSDASSGGYSLDRLGRDVLELLDALSLEAVDFCGLSLGGMIGQWLGIRAPERIRRLVLANTSAYMGPPSNWDSRIAAAVRDGMAPLAEASVARWFTPDFAAANPATIAPIREGLYATDPIGYAGSCAAIRDMDMRRIGILNPLSVLVIGGTLDPATPPADSDALATVIPNARLVMLEAAHLSNIEQPGDFSRHVIDFLVG